MSGHARDHIEALDNLFLAWFNPDWRLDYADADSVLREYRSTDPALASLAAHEIDDLLADEAATDEALEALLLNRQAPDPRAGAPMRDWLLHARSVLLDKN